MPWYVKPAPVNRRLGKRAAVVDTRMALLHAVARPAQLPPVPKWVNWRANLPDTGVPMLGNEKCGCCVFATIFHYLECAAAYTRHPLPSAPTEAECIEAYSLVTGYDPDDPNTDLGTYVMGRGGAVEHWARVGIVCGGVRNRLARAATVNFKDPDALKQALALGPVMMGASMSEVDCLSPFMWDQQGGDMQGGHEFLCLGFETLSSGKTYYDVETWDGMWRATDDWVAHAVDECVIPLNRAFFDASGVSPSGLDWATVDRLMRAVA